MEYASQRLIHIHYSGADFVVEHRRMGGYSAESTQGRNESVSQAQEINIEAGVKKGEKRDEVKLHQRVYSE
jgi:hypothetical protein